MSQGLDRNISLISLAKQMTNVLIMNVMKIHLVLIHT